MNFLKTHNVKTVQEFLAALVVHSISIQGLFELQQLAIKDGYLNVDEMEQAKTVAYEVRRLFKNIEGLVNLLSFRIEINPDTIIENLKTIYEDQQKVEDKEEKIEAKKIKKAEKVKKVKKTNV